MDAVETVVGIGLVFPESRSPSDVQYMTADMSKSRVDAEAPTTKWTMRSPTSDRRGPCDTRGAHTVPLEGELTVRQLPSQPAVSLALDAQRRLHLLVRAPGIGPSRFADDVAALEIRRRPLIVGGEQQQFLDVACRDSVFDEVFEYFVVAIAERRLATGDSWVTAVCPSSTNGATF